MTIEEKRNAIKQHCNNHGWCNNSENGECALIHKLHCYENASDEEINNNYEILFGTKDVEGDKAMTIEEMDDVIQEYCNQTNDCKIHSICQSVSGDFIANPNECEQAYKVITNNTPDPTANPEPTNDIINHPSHYCRDGGMESIDEMVLVFGKTAVMHFCLCNVWKYRYRSSSKNGEEDLKKSDWYMKKYKELSYGE